MHVLVQMYSNLLFKIVYSLWGDCNCEGGLSIPDVALDRDYKYILEAH